MTTSLVRFTPTAFAGVYVALASVRPAQLADEVHKAFAGAGRYYQGEAAVLDCTAVTDWPAQVDWAGIAALMRRIGLQPIGVRGVPEAHLHSLARAALPLLDALALAGRDAAEPRSAAESTQSAESAFPAPQSVTPATLFVDRPVRSGVRIYHPNGDVVLMQGVNPGGEVIAAGHIHCWGTLAGRAIAGANGFAEARILVARFAPELVAIAGIYKTFEQGVVASLASKAVQVRLQRSTSAEDLRLQFDPIEG